MNTETKLNEIFNLIKNDDPHSIELLYENYFRLLYGIAFSIVRNKEMSEDVVQNTIIKIWNIKHETLPKSHEMSWLYTVTKNEALCILRKEKKNENIAAYSESSGTGMGIK